LALRVRLLVLPSERGSLLYLALMPVWLWARAFQSVLEQVQLSTPGSWQVRTLVQE
jgi:hypothetical protein